ncbi:MAG: MarR family winged helix-turn-helix transcriptional regulator [Burkholderiaceae bacterium]
MTEKPRKSSLDHARRHGFGRLLLLARRDFVTRLKDMLRANGEMVFRSMMISPYIDGDGTRIVEIARRMGISKQAVGRMVGELEEAGLVAQRADPADGRATLVSFTPEGLRYMKRMHRFVRKVEDEYRELVGAEVFSATRRALRTIAYGERTDDPSDGARPERDSGAK